MIRLSILLLMIVVVGSTTLWGIDGVLPGDGTEGDPYIIEDLADFDAFADSANAATYWASGVYTTLVCDPNMAGRTYTTAVIAPDTPDTSSDFDGIPFEGVFDGDGHVVSNLTIDAAGAGNNYLGLFGRIEGSSGEVKDLGMENTNINGGEGSWLLGGLCGHNEGGTITNCYSEGSVTGDNNLGGLCGTTSGPIVNCFAIGSVSGSGGGLVGHGGSPTTNCFWNTETSGMTNSYGGMGLTTVQMQSAITYSLNGWGGSDVWVIDDGKDYPRLVWENKPGLSIPPPPSLIGLQARAPRSIRTAYIPLWNSTKLARPQFSGTSISC